MASIIARLSTRFRPWVAPILLFVIILSITLGLNKSVTILIDSELANAKGTTELIKRLVEGNLLLQVRAVQAVALNLTTNRQVRRRSFEGFSSATMADVPGLIAIAVVDSDLNPRWITLDAIWADAREIGVQTGAPAPELMLRAEAVRDALAQTARSLRERTFSGPPFDLTKHVHFPLGEKGFTGYAVMAPYPLPGMGGIPAPEESREIDSAGSGGGEKEPVEGYVIGVVDSRELSDTMLAWLRIDPAFRFDFEPVDHVTGATQYLRAQDEADRAEPDPVNTSEFPIGSQFWKVTYNPPQLYQGTYSELATSGAIMLLGLVLAALASLMLYRQQLLTVRSQSDAMRSRSRLATTSDSLARIKEELDLIVNNVDEAIVLYDENLAPLQTNAAFQQAFPEVESLGFGESARDAHHPALARCFTDRSRYGAMLEHLRDQPEKPFVDEVERAPAAGDKTHTFYQVRATTVVGPGGDQRGFLVLYQDISHRRTVERLKEDFLSSVTHDLRTPLASIKGFAETMLRDTRMESQTREEFTRIICNESTRLQEMIEDLLDLRRMEAGKIDLSPATFNLRGLVEEIVAAAQPLLDTKGQRIDLQWEGGGERGVCGDVGKIGRAVRNVLGNAMKYSPQDGSIQIRGRETERGIELEVIDAGPGIPPDELQHVFEKFYRGSRHVRRTQGTGLGLAIVKHIVESHGGRATARNAPGGGAIIRIFLPWELNAPVSADGPDPGEGVNGHARHGEVEQSAL